MSEPKTVKSSLSSSISFFVSSLASSSSSSPSSSAAAASSSLMLLQEDEDTRDSRWYSLGSLIRRNHGNETLAPSVMKPRFSPTNSDDYESKHQSRFFHASVHPVSLLRIVLWLVTCGLLVLVLFRNEQEGPFALFLLLPPLISSLWESNHVRYLKTQTTPSNDPNETRPRILYIITTLAEYNSGTRNTVKDSDRLQETLIPVMSESVQSMLQSGYQVDVYLICHFILRPERYQLVRNALPDQVGLEFWNSATPLGYDTSSAKFKKLENRTLHLARQHRFVIKDKIKKYDMFVCFEDDMVIHSHHIQHFLAVTDELFRLREHAPDSVHLPDGTKPDNHYYGPLTKGMLKRMIPGFIRVEVLLDEEKYPAQSDLGPIPLDYIFTSKNHEGKAEYVQPEFCCHVKPTTSNHHIPISPTADKLMLWETNIGALGVRQMPSNSWLKWVTTLRGPQQSQLDKKQIIGDYWSNRYNKWYDKSHREYGRRPSPGEFKFINNQGGWMATRRQLWEWHTEICPGGFLPPYEAPHYRYDGLDMRNVEWYSGGMQLSTFRHACNMQRIIVIDNPANFSKSLLYHSANNKQRQLAEEGKRPYFTKANTLLAQLNTIRKQAEREIPQH